MEGRGMGKVAFIFTMVMTMLAVFAPPPQALGTPKPWGDLLPLLLLRTYQGERTDVRDVAAV